MSTLEIPQTRRAAIPAGFGSRLGLAAILLACALAVFLLGPKHSPLFPTNGSILYNGLVCAVFLGAALHFKRNQRFTEHWGNPYAFFIAAAVNLNLCLFGHYSSDIQAKLGVSGFTNPGIALDKVYESLLAVITIVALTKLSGADLRSLFLSRGNQHRTWGWGIGLLVLFNFLTSVLIFFGMSYKASQLGGVIMWGLVFAMSNSLLEELWIRGLFLKKVTPLIGVTGAVIISSIWFGVMHFSNFAFLPAAVVPVMVINTVSLGLACAVIMVKTDSLWGAWLIHAAADVFLFIATLAFR